MDTFSGSESSIPTYHDRVAQTLVPAGWRLVSPPADAVETEARSRVDELLMSPPLCAWLGRMSRRCSSGNRGCRARTRPGAGGAVERQAPRRVGTMQRRVLSWRAAPRLA